MSSAIESDRNEAKAIKDNDWLRPGEWSSAIGEKPWSPVGADKAQLALETVGSFVPGIGTAIAAKDYTNAIENNDSVGGVLAAAQFLPIFGDGAKLGSTFLGGPSKYAIKMMRRGGVTEKGMEKAIKHGGSAAFTANIVQTIKDLAD